MQKTRNPWTEDDVALLLSVYEAESGPLVYPPELLARHSQSSCTAEAHKRHFTNKERPRQRGELFTLSPTDAAYMAGIIDGEGWVSQKDSLISVSSTTPCITDWLFAHVPGSRLAPPMTPPNPKHKVVHRWYVGWHTSVEQVAAQILPWVLIDYKRRRLEELASAIGRQTGPVAPNTSAAGVGRGIAGYKRSDVCVRGHDRSGLKLGQNCPECQKVWKQRMIDKGTLSRGGRAINRDIG